MLVAIKRYDDLNSSDKKIEEKGEYCENLKFLTGLDTNVKWELLDHDKAARIIKNDILLKYFIKSLTSEEL